MASGDSRRAITQALAAVKSGDDSTATNLAAQAANQGSPLGASLAQYLESIQEEAVYASPAGFEAFIEGGGNVPLYRAVSNALADLYDRLRPAALLDIGCGNGRALIPALQVAQHQPEQLDLVEPSEALLAAAVKRHAETALSAALRTWPGTVQAFLETLPAGSHWPMVQSTFAMHTIPHEERTAVLARLRAHLDVLVVVDFDVPNHPTGSTNHLSFLAQTYEQGLAEYDADQELVAQGFLMPVLVGQLRPGATRVTWEQSKEQWLDQMKVAGYADVEVRPLYNYWSSPAFVLTARAS
ncbi:MAG TPA: class I SAM-dependent methyltransferase [Kineosporiaceae bacterium]|nr:class I SAM-dependent methyltransferase [Kineosporiaceae bacterium]